MRKFIVLFSFLVAFSISATHAVERSIIAVPTAWLLHEYLVDNVVVFYTGHPYPCGGAAQVLSIPTDAGTATRNRFWATISLAKVTGKQVIVYFNDENCLITSFGLRQE